MQQKPIREKRGIQKKEISKKEKCYRAENKTKKGGVTTIRDWSIITNKDVSKVTLLDYT